MSENKNIYKGLECHCKKFERIPIDRRRRDLGYAGKVSTYRMAITQDFADYELGRYLKQKCVGIWGRVSARMLIKINGGLLSFLQTKIEGKSNEQ